MRPCIVSNLVCWFQTTLECLFHFICMGCHVGAHPDGHQHGGQKPTETSVTEFCYKSVNLSLEELKNIKIILFLIQEPVKIAKFPEMSHFLTNSAVM